MNYKKDLNEKTDHLDNNENENETFKLSLSLESNIVSHLFEKQKKNGTTIEEEVLSILKRSIKSSESLKRKRNLEVEEFWDNETKSPSTKKRKTEVFNDNCSGFVGTSFVEQTINDFKNSYQKTHPSVVEYICGKKTKTILSFLTTGITDEIFSIQKNLKIGYVQNNQIVGSQCKKLKKIEQSSCISCRRLKSYLKKRLYNIFETYTSSEKSTSVLKSEKKNHSIVYLRDLLLFSRENSLSAIEKAIKKAKKCGINFQNQNNFALTLCTEIIKNQVYTQSESTKNCTRREYSDDVKIFFNYIKAKGGKGVVEILNRNGFGPSNRTLQNYRYLCSLSSNLFFLDTHHNKLDSQSLMKKLNLL